MRTPLRRFATCAVLLLCACASVGPDYKRPQQAAPNAFVEAGPWKVAQPQDTIARGHWWESFNDPVLNDLEARALKQSPDLKAAAARVLQAQAIAGITGSFLYPELDLVSSGFRYGVSGNRPDQPSKAPLNAPYAANDFRVPLYATYEVDVWGRVRRLVEAADARFEASVAAYYTVLLTLQGDVAQTYFLLRANDDLLRILRENIELRRQGRDVVDARKRGGLASDLDLARAEAALASTQALAEAAAKTRAELVYRLAVLTGTLPEQFQVAEAPFAITPPAIPVGLPSDLLQRRPDIAEAERRLAARNAEIGVAKAAYFPSITLTAAVGYESSELSDLLKRDSSIWALGGFLFEPIFTAGRIGFDVDRAKAAYDENLAIYQARILQGFQEVESALAGLRILDQQAKYQAVAVTNADKATKLAYARYKAGLVALIEVLDAQSVSLQAERDALFVTSNQLLTTIALIKALGGGWEGRPMPTPNMPAPLATAK
ncbi:MAG TPA: efflux transporter outer membrane subunit [Burkholderiales bacterium]|nr:efflux transporter outer membrane subunit [Burkholderiales bacterium]